MNFSFILGVSGGFAAAADGLSCSKDGSGLGAVDALKPVHEELSRNVDLYPELGAPVLEAASGYQNCVLSRRLEAFVRASKKTTKEVESEEQKRQKTKDLETAERLLHLINGSEGDPGAQVLLGDVLKWALRVMDRGLLRNAASYAWDRFVPESVKEEYPVETSFENLDGIAVKLKQKSLGMLKEINLVDPAGSVKFKPGSSSEKNEELKKRFRKKKFISTSDMIGLVMHTDTDPQFGEAGFQLLLKFASSPLVLIGEDLMKKVGPALESKLGKNPSTIDRARELKDAIDALPRLRSMFDEALGGKLAVDAEEWADNVLRDVMGVDRCQKELTALKKASTVYARTARRGG